MKRPLLFLLGCLWCAQTFGQVSSMSLPPGNDIEFQDFASLTRERWRDSLFRMDMAQVPTGYLLEYSLAGFEPQLFNGLGGNDIICEGS